MTLAWQVHKLSTSRDPMAEAAGIPGATAMARFLEAAAARGVPAQHIRDAAIAINEFDALVKTHAGDRTAFDSMLSSIGGNGSEQIDLQHKRAAFKANAHLWGVQAEVQLSCFVFQPSANDPDRLDLLGIRGLLGLKRLRREASWVISRARMSDDDGQIRRSIHVQPIDPIDSDSPSVSLLRKFCTQPLPKFRSVPTEAGFVNVQLEPTSVGNTSAITCLLAEWIRDEPLSCEIWESVDFSFSITVLNDEILSFDVTEITKTLTECLDARRDRGSSN